MTNIFFEIHRDLPRESPGGDEYTQQAWNYLPPLVQPKILDIGCGPGAQTLALARISQGHITAIDTHLPFLEHLRQQAKVLGWGDRIRAEAISMLDLSGLQEVFDVIWAEGSIYIVGVETGLQQWRSHLKSNGYLVFSDLIWLTPNPPIPIQDYWKEAYPAMQTLEQELHSVQSLGYQVLGYFVLPKQAWWNYYTPLEVRIQHLTAHHQSDAEALAILNSEQQEINQYRTYSDSYGYAFFVLQRID